MAETRHRTILEYRVDDRQIRGLDETLHKAFDVKQLEAFESVLERSAKHIDTLAKAAERLDSAMRRSGMGGGPGGGGGGRAPTGGGGGQTDPNLNAAIMTLSRSMAQLGQAQRSGPGFMSQALATGMGTYLGGLLAHVGGGGEGIIGRIVSGIPIVGGLLSAATSSVQSYYGEFAAAQQAISRTVGGTGRRRMSRQTAGVMTSFGLAQPEAFAQMGQISSQSGLTGNALTGDVLRQATALQFLGGIPDAAQIIGAEQTAGGPMMGGQRPARAMMQAVSAGVMSGMREARLGQFVSAATSVLEQGRTEGADLSADTINRMMVGFASLGAGFTGERAQRAMSSAIPTLRNFQPGTDVATAVMLRSVGFGTPGGPSYHEALRQFQDNPAQVLPQVLETIRSMAPGNEDAQVELMRQLGPRFLGMTPMIGQAQDLVRGNLGAFGEEVTTEGASRFLAGRAGLRGAFGVPASEAAYRNQRIGIGGQVAGTALQIRAIETAITQTTLPRIAQGIGSILTILQGLYDVLQAGGLSGLMGATMGGIARNLFSGLGVPDAGAIGDVVGSMASHPIDTIREVVGDYIDQMTAPTPNNGAHFVLTPQPGGGLGLGIATDQPQAQPQGENGPTSSAADALRRISRDAAVAAQALDAAGLPSDGATAIG